jgi:hypothetical protein
VSSERGLKEALEELRWREKDLEALKRKKPQEAAERERVLRQLEEDKAERQLKFQSPAAAAAALEAQPIAEASSSRSAAEQSASAAEQSATLNIRTEEGAVRHTFSADTTLAQVRDWLLEEQRRRDHEVPPQGPGGSSHVLGDTETAEIARQGRENFQRQTARLREEARAIRMGDRMGDTGARTVIFFVSPMPRADFLSEGAMQTTLREAGLCPSGTLMVRRQLAMPPPPPGEALFNAAADPASTRTKPRREDNTKP